MTTTATTATDVASTRTKPVDGAAAVDVARRRASEWYALAACGAFWAVFAWRSAASPSGRRFTLFDDAMISMRYGQTLADGHGFVWYPGAPKVEGYTNPLWT